MRYYGETIALPASLFSSKWAVRGSAEPRKYEGEMRKILFCISTMIIHNTLLFVQDVNLPSMKPKWFCLLL